VFLRCRFPTGGVGACSNIQNSARNCSLQKDPMVILADWYAKLRQERIVDAIKNDRRSLEKPGSLLGWPFDRARTAGIGNGQANFDEGIENLTPSDRTRLYAYINQGGHVEELVLAFRSLVGDSLALDGAAVIDVGCGPFTAGLAIANVVGPDQSFDYFGVDLSHSMCELGSELAQAARDVEALGPQTSVRFSRDINNVSPEGTRGGHMTLVVLSYLLASRSLEVEKITADVIAACDRMSMGAVNLLYTNSTNAWAGRNYIPFKAMLEASGFKCVVERMETITETRNRRDVHYALFRRPAVTRISPGIFKK
jgi:SAM-dependent methyltransferase